MNNKYGLVLAGGGSKGAYQIGAWIAMRELKIEFEAVAGVSIGAINGALITMNDLENALRFWESIAVEKGVKTEEPLPDPNNLFSRKNWPVLLREIIKNGGFDASPAEEFFKEFIDEEKVRKSKTALGLVTINVTQETPLHLFIDDIPNGELIDYLLASADIPLALNVGPDEERFLDGGAYDNLPVSFMRENGFNRLIVVDISTIKGVGHDLKINNCSLVYIRPHNLDDLGASFDFSAEMNAKRMHLGYLDTMKAFGKYLGNIFCFEPKVFREMVKKHGAKTVFQLEQLAYKLKLDITEVYDEEKFLSGLKGLYEEEKLKRAESGKDEKKKTGKEKERAAEGTGTETAVEEEEKEDKRGGIFETLSKLASAFLKDDDERPVEEKVKELEESEDDDDDKKGSVISAMLELIKTKRKIGEDVSLAEDFLENYKG